MEPIHDDEDDEDSTIFLLEICPLKDLSDLRMHFLKNCSPPLPLSVLDRNNNTNMASFWHLDTVWHHIFWDTDDDDNKNIIKPIATGFHPALKCSERVFPSDFVFWGNNSNNNSSNNDNNNVLLHQVTIFSPLLR